ncbi:DNA polymerase I [bacterium]|nr:DNA polymerase I [bacterium]
MAETPRLYLIDGTALAYRAYFAFMKNPLINSKGINTSGPYGFTSMLMRLLRDENPEAVCCIFDAKGPTFRHEMYSEYKATRERMPDEMREQLPIIHEVVKALNIPIIQKSGVEADDVIGTLARRGEEAGMDVFIVSGDKDMLQLVTDKVKVMVQGRGAQSGQILILDADGVKEKMGVRPDQMIDFMGLMGDSSDNIPGIPGVGPKTALKLLDEFGSFEGVFANRDKVTRKSLKEKLETHEELARLSLDLVTVRTDLDLEISVDEIHRQPLDPQKAMLLFKELEFTRFIGDLAALSGKEGADVPAPEPMRRDYHTIQTRAELEALVRQLNSADGFAFDLETTSVSPMAAEIVGFSFAVEAGEAWYVPVLAPEFDREGQWLELSDEERLSTSIELLSPMLENPEIDKFGQNIKYDVLVLRQYGVYVKGIAFDTMLAAYVLNPSNRRFNLDTLAFEHLGMEKIPTKSVIGTGRKQITMDQAPLKLVAEYACEDADAVVQLKDRLAPRLKNSGLDSLYNDIELPLIDVLIGMEEAGVALDCELLGKMSTSMQIKLDGLIVEIYEAAGEEFNINSPQQLGKILFEKLKIHEIAGWKRAKRTKTGYSTDVKVLEALAFHPLPQRLLEYRQLTKLKSTYVDALPRMILKKTGRVHASFNQTVAATGRLSTSDPNLQNIPIRTELGREIRKAFVPGERGWKILSADYSQIELRVMAHVSGDETMLDAFRKDEDIHRRTASEIFDVGPEDVTDDMRRNAKTINFGIIFGMGAYGLSSRLKISVPEAEAFISAYFERYPKVNMFMANTIAQAHENGYVTTLMHRRRYLPELVSDNRNMRDFGERTAINTPIQGTAADLIKIAMINIARRLQSGDWQAKMILQIHDELLFEVPDVELEKLKDMVREEMEGALELSVPIKVDMGVGDNWFEAH